MSIQSMQCPKCGKAATEYDKNKWKCLHCQTNFIYEPPKELQAPKIEVLNQQIEIKDFPKDGLVYQCQICGLNYSCLTSPPQPCRSCGTSLCMNCLIRFGGLCKTCFQMFVDEQSRISKQQNLNTVKSIGGVGIGCFVLLIFFSLVSSLFEQAGCNSEPNKPQKYQGSEQKLMDHEINQEDQEEEQKNIEQEIIEEQRKLDLQSKEKAYQDSLPRRKQLESEKDKLKSELETAKRKASYLTATDEDKQKVREIFAAIKEIENKEKELPSKPE